MSEQNRTTEDVSPPIQAINLRFRFPGQPADLFRDVNLTVNRGEVVILAGPNGCGKSSLLGLITGRLHPLDGSVSVYGANPRRASRLPDVGLVTEPFHPEQSPLPVDLSLRQITRWLSVLDAIDLDDAAAVFDQLSLGKELIDHPIWMLSKGERQRAMVAVVLLRRPGLVLADEPLEGIDRRSRRVISETLQRYSRNNGQSVFWISHHLSETMQYADRLLDLEDGRVTDHTTTGFVVTVLDGSKEAKQFKLPSLDGLPSIVEPALGTHQRLRIEIASTETSG